MYVCILCMYPVCASVCVYNMVESQSQSEYASLRGDISFKLSALEQ